LIRSADKFINRGSTQKGHRGAESGTRHLDNLAGARQA